MFLGGKSRHRAVALADRDALPRAGEKSDGVTTRVLLPQSDLSLASTRAIFGIKAKGFREHSIPTDGMFGLLLSRHTLNPCGLVASGRRLRAGRSADPVPFGRPPVKTFWPDPPRAGPCRGTSTCPCQARAVTSPLNAHPTCSQAKTRSAKHAPNRRSVLHPSLRTVRPGPVYI